MVVMQQTESHATRQAKLRFHCLVFSEMHQTTSLAQKKKNLVLK